MHSISIPASSNEAQYYANIKECIKGKNKKNNKSNKPKQQNLKLENKISKNNSKTKTNNENSSQSNKKTNGRKSQSNKHTLCSVATKKLKNDSMPEYYSQSEICENNSISIPASCNEAQYSANSKECIGGKTNKNNKSNKPKQQNLKLQNKISKNNSKTKTNNDNSSQSNKKTNGRKSQSNRHTLCSEATKKQKNDSMPEFYSQSEICENNGRAVNGRLSKPGSKDINPIESTLATNFQRSSHGATIMADVKSLQIRDSYEQRPRNTFNLLSSNPNHNGTGKRSLESSRMINSYPTYPLNVPISPQKANLVDLGKKYERNNIIHYSATYPSHQVSDTMTDKYDVLNESTLESYLTTESNSVSSKPKQFPYSVLNHNNPRINTKESSSTFNRKNKAISSGLNTIGVNTNLNRTNTLSAPMSDLVSQEKLDSCVNRTYPFVNNAFALNTAHKESSQNIHGNFNATLGNNTNQLPSEKTQSIHGPVHSYYNHCYINQYATTPIYHSMINNTNAPHELSCNINCNQNPYAPDISYTALNNPYQMNYNNSNSINYDNAITTNSYSFPYNELHVTPMLKNYSSQSNQNKVSSVNRGMNDAIRYLPSDSVNNYQLNTLNYGLSNKHSYQENHVQPSSFLNYPSNLYSNKNYFSKQLPHTYASFQANNSNANYQNQGHCENHNVMLPEMDKTGQPVRHLFDQRLRIKSALNSSINNKNWSVECTPARVSNNYINSYQTNANNIDILNTNETVFPKDSENLSRKRSLDIINHATTEKKQCSAFHTHQRSEVLNNNGLFNYKNNNNFNTDWDTTNFSQTTAKHLTAPVNNEVHSSVAQQPKDKNDLDLTSNFIPPYIHFDEPLKNSKSNDMNIEPLNKPLETIPKNHSTLAVNGLLMDTLSSAVVQPTINNSTQSSNTHYIITSLNMNKFKPRVDNIINPVSIDNTQNEVQLPLNEYFNSTDHQTMKISENSKSKNHLSDELTNITFPKANCSSFMNNDSDENPFISSNVIQTPSTDRIGSSDLYLNNPENGEKIFNYGGSYVKYPAINMNTLQFQDENSKKRISSIGTSETAQKYPVEKNQTDSLIKNEQLSQAAIDSTSNQQRSVQYQSSELIKKGCFVNSHISNPPTNEQSDLEVLADIICNHDSSLQVHPSASNTDKCLHKQNFPMEIQSSVSKFNFKYFDDKQLKYETQANISKISNQYNDNVTNKNSTYLNVSNLGQDLLNNVGSNNVIQDSIQSTLPKQMSTVSKFEGYESKKTQPARALLADLTDSSVATTCRVSIDRDQYETITNNLVDPKEKCQLNTKVEQINNSEEKINAEKLLEDLTGTNINSTLIDPENTDEADRIPSINGDNLSLRKNISDKTLISKNVLQENTLKGKEIIAPLSPIDYINSTEKQPQCITHISDMIDNDHTTTTKNCSKEKRTDKKIKTYLHHNLKTPVFLNDNVEDKNNRHGTKKVIKSSKNCQPHTSIKKESTKTCHNDNDSTSKCHKYNLAKNKIAQPIIKSPEKSFKHHNGEKAGQMKHKDVINSSYVHKEQLLNSSNKKGFVKLQQNNKLVEVEKSSNVKTIKTKENGPSDKNVTPLNHNSNLKTLFSSKLDNTTKKQKDFAKDLIEDKYNRTKISPCASKYKRGHKETPNNNETDTSNQGKHNSTSLIISNNNEHSSDKLNSKKCVEIDNFNHKKGFQTLAIDSIHKKCGSSEEKIKRNYHSKHNLVIDSQSNIKRSKRKNTTYQESIKINLKGHNKAPCNQTAIKTSNIRAKLLRLSKLDSSRGHSKNYKISNQNKINSNSSTYIQSSKNRQTDKKVSDTVKSDVLTIEKSKSCKADVIKLTCSLTNAKTKRIIRGESKISKKYIDTPLTRTMNEPKKKFVDSINMDKLANPVNPLKTPIPKVKDRKVSSHRSSLIDSKSSDKINGLSKFCKQSDSTASRQDTKVKLSKSDKSQLDNTTTTALSTTNSKDRRLLVKEVSIIPPTTVINCSIDKLSSKLSKKRHYYCSSDKSNSPEKKKKKINKSKS